LSKKNTNLAIELNDVQDGKILLIEAANVLPDWVNDIPSNKLDKFMQNRVWVVNGKMHLIEPHFKIFDKMEAIRIISCSDVVSVASDAIQDCISNRIQKFLPLKLSNDIQHRAAVYLPLEIAQILQLRHDLISTCILSYYYFNTKNHNNSELEFPFENLVSIVLPFSRLNYALITNSSFENTKAISETIEMKRIKRSCQIDTSEYLRHAYDVGLRISLGLNYMYQFSFNLSKKSKKDFNHLSVDQSLCPFSQPNIPLYTQLINAQKKSNLTLSSVKPTNPKHVDNDDWLHIQDLDLYLQSLADDDVGSSGITSNQTNLKFPAEKKISQQNHLNQSLDNMMHGIKNFVQNSSTIEGVVSDSNTFSNHIDYFSDDSATSTDTSSSSQTYNASNMDDIMTAMDDELQQHYKATLEHFSTQPTLPGDQSHSSSFDENVLSNLLSSLNASEIDHCSSIKTSNPVKNIFNEIGLHNELMTLQHISNHNDDISSNDSDTSLN